MFQIDGVYGSRMTGGGFGGCTVTLLTKVCVIIYISSYIFYSKIACGGFDGCTVTLLTKVCLIIYILK